MTLTTKQGVRDLNAFGGAVTKHVHRHIPHNFTTHPGGPFMTRMQCYCGNVADDVEEREEQPPRRATVVEAAG